MEPLTGLLQAFVVNLPVGKSAPLICIGPSAVEFRVVVVVVCDTVDEYCCCLEKLQPCKGMNQTFG